MDLSIENDILLSFCQHISASGKDPYSLEAYGLTIEGRLENKDASC